MRLLTGTCQPFHLPCSPFLVLYKQLQKTGWLLLFCMVTSAHLQAQCSPDRTAVWNQLLSVIDNDHISNKEKIKTFKADLDQMNNCPYKDDSVHAFLEQLLGEVYLGDHDFPKSIQYYQLAISTIKANTGKTAISRGRLIANYYCLSNAYDSMNNIAEKIRAIDTCIRISVELNRAADMYCIRSLYERIVYSFDVGDYNRCIESAKMCEQLSRQYMLTVLRGSWEYNTGRSIAESSLGWYVKAQLMLLNDYAAAEKFLANKPAEYKKAGMENYLGSVYAHLAEIEIEKGNHQKALSYYYTGLGYAKQAGYYFTCKQIMNNIGNNIYFSLLKDDNKALACYRKALTYINKDPNLHQTDAMESLSIYGNIADVYARQNQYDSAMKYFQLAFDQASPGLNENSIYKSTPEKLKDYAKLYYLENLLIDKGDAVLQNNKPGKQVAVSGNAISIYKAADYLLDRIREIQSDLESKLFWRANYKRLYEHAVEACYLQKNYTAALYFFEKSRAVLLNDQLIEQHLMDATDIASLIPLKKKKYALQEDMAAIPVNSEAYASAQAALFKSKEELSRAEQGMKARYPLYSTGSDTANHFLQDVQKKLLGKFQSLVELFSGDSAVYVLTVTADNISFQKIDKAAFDKSVALYTSYVADRDLLNSDFTGFRNTAHELYQLIFQNTIPRGRIIVSPDGKYFPFESLVANNRSSKPVYLLSNCAVTYTYSVRYMMDDIFPVLKTDNTRDFLGVAPVTYNKAFGLPALAGSDGSLQKMETYFSETDLLTGNNATKNKFLQQFPLCQVLQLYTHASDSSNKNEPVIYFADDALYLSELSMANKPRAQLVVLSACKTGNGRLYQGEGVFNFSRGFSALGIPSSIINLWSVDNMATYSITENFYHYLQEGLPTDICLQKAKLDYISKASGENQLPYYWAAEVLTGRADVIKTKNPLPWKWMLVSTGCIALIITGSWWFKKKKQ